LLRFLAVSTGWLLTHHRDEHGRAVDVVHVHNIPDFLVFAALISKLRGATVVLDIHDIVPEFFASKFGRGEVSWLARALLLMERWSAGAADHVILANHLWLDRYTSRSAPRTKCSVFINHVDASIFKPRSLQPVGREPLVLFPGGLQPHQGLDIAIRAFASLLRRLPSARFHIYGDGAAKADLVALTEELGLKERVRFFDPMPLREIAKVMATADLGVVPKRADSFGNEAYSTKIMEFMSLGVPVVASATRIDKYYFDGSVLRFFESGNVDALADAMYELLTEASLREGMISNAWQYVARHDWAGQKRRYLALVDTLHLGVQPAAEAQGKPR
jgi:glycosyltransferase involved in cell wall biosynthesis